MSAEHRRARVAEEWEKAIDNTRLNKTTMNNIIMDYLIISGHKEAAEKFARESGTEPKTDLSSLDERMAIRSAIEQGNIDASIEMLNDLDAEILDTNDELYFHLQLQKLVELISQGQIMGALQFAQQELAARGRQNPAYLAELERVMSLLAFEDKSLLPEQDLIDGSRRMNTASEVNAAILQAQNLNKDPKLMYVLKLLLWSERQMDKKKIKYPKVNIEALLHGHSHDLNTQEQIMQTIDHLMAQIHRDEELMDLSQDK
jgi:hypothetical protein